jgi:Zn-dependent protease with chaperone function
MRLVLPLLLLLYLPALPLQAQAPLVLRLTLVQFAGGSWQEHEIEAAAAQAARILGQCGIVPGATTLVRADVEARFRLFHTPTSRELARHLRPGTPAIYFVDGTRQNPAFDAEAIGRGNSRSRPELRDTVWVVRGARDLDVVLAHELAHVLMDSGEHSQEPGNLMREETTPENTRLSNAQCSRLRETGFANGLLLALPR